MAEKLAGECLGGRAEIVYDPEPDGYRSPWRTYRLALERGLDATAGTTHRLIVQDDVYVCDYFRDAVDLAGAARPDDVLVFFVGGRPFPQTPLLDRARALGRPWAWLDPRSYCPVVATAWPVALIAPMLDWIAEKRYPAQMSADDELTGRYLRDAGIRPLASVPSLVEHPDTVYSLASGGRRHHNGLDAGRCAHLFAEDDDTDVRLIDWTLAPVPDF